ncbi:MAG: protein TolQ [Acidobacteriota bacterium]
MSPVNLVVAEGVFGGFWSLVANSGLIAQMVLFILLFFSIVSWTIIIKKYRFFRDLREQSLRFYQDFRRCDQLSEIYKNCEKYPASPLAGIFKRAYEELNQELEPADTSADGPIRVKTLNGLQRSMQRASVAEMTTLEQSLNWLATTGSVTPFIGLFGTVIGIINAFQGLGEGSATTIQAVAPGISEALVATAAGLFAAIPAVIGYNHFISRLRVIGAEMDDFSTELLNLIERSFT